VDDPKDLLATIDRTLRHYGTTCAQARRQAVADLYPYAGQAAQRAVEVLTSYLEDME